MRGFARNGGKQGSRVKVITMYKSYVRCGSHDDFIGGEEAD